MPSIVQLEHVTSPSAVMWYLCMTSQRTFRALQAAQAFAALLLTGFGLPALSRPAAEEPRFFEAGSLLWAAGDCDADALSAEGDVVVFSVPMMTAAGIATK